MAMDGGYSLEQSATSSADGDNELSQETVFGDYIIGAPNWISSRRGRKDRLSDGSGIDTNLMYLGMGSLLLLGVYLWKFKK